VAPLSFLGRHERVARAGAHISAFANAWNAFLETNRTMPIFEIEGDGTRKPSLDCRAPTVHAAGWRALLRHTSLGGPLPATGSR